MDNKPQNTEQLDPKSDAKPGYRRNLVVCIDGTSNKFSSDLKYSNVIKLYRLAEKSENQLTYYNSGIGTYARPPPWSLRHFKLATYHRMNQAFAWTLESIVFDAYRWLSDHYKTGDRIFLFGFSRGAYQVRVLSAMISRVGLIHKGNQKQIPFAYELYAGLKDSIIEEKERAEDALSQSGKNEVEKGSESAMTQPSLRKMNSQSAVDQKTPSAEQIFKDAFCREVTVHFVGAWDTVSSVGVIRGESHPDTTNGMQHVSYFRHALALDERRIKFLPEYACGGAAHSKDTDSHHTSLGGHPHTKEVWFTGTHPDIGGVSTADVNEELLPPLAWMYMEAAQMGLYVVEKLQTFQPRQIHTKTLTAFWWLLELLPLKRLSYGTGKNAAIHTTRIPHLGSGRKVLAGQMIHESVHDFCHKGYRPAARLSSSWDSSRSGTSGSAGFPTEPWGAVKHVQDYSEAIRPEDQQSILEHIYRSARTEIGKLTLRHAGVFHVLRTLPTSNEGEVHIQDLTKLRDIFDEVYEGRIPEKLAYEQVQPLLAHVLVKHDATDPEFQVALKFIRDFTDISPVCVSLFHIHDDAKYSPVIFAAFLPGGSSRVIAASEDGVIRIWNTATERKVIRLLHPGGIKSFACSPDGQHAVSASSTTVYIWDITTGKFTKRSCPEAFLLGPVNFSPKPHNDIIICWTNDTETYVHVTNGHDPGTLFDDATRRPLNMSDVSAARQLLSNSSRVHLETMDKRLLSSGLFKDDLTGVVCVAFSPDGDLAACGKNDAFLAIFRWDKAPVNPGYERVRTLGGSGIVKTIAFSPDSRHLLAGGQDNHIRIWDTEHWYEKIALLEHTGHVNAVAVSEDNSRMVSCSDDGTVRVWNAEKLLQNPSFHETGLQ